MTSKTATVLVGLASLFAGLTRKDSTNPLCHVKYLAHGSSVL